MPIFLYLIILYPFTFVLFPTCDIVLFVEFTKRNITFRSCFDEEMDTIPLLNRGDC